MEEIAELGDSLERKVRGGHEGQCPKRQSPWAIWHQNNFVKSWKP